MRKLTLFLLVLVAYAVMETNGWRFRIRTPRIRIPRIRVPRIRIPRIRIPRIRIPRIRVPTPCYGWGCRYPRYPPCTGWGCRLYSVQAKPQLQAQNKPMFTINGLENCALWKLRENCTEDYIPQDVCEKNCVVCPASGEGCPEECPLDCCECGQIEKTPEFEMDPDDLESLAEIYGDPDIDPETMKDLEYMDAASEENPDDNPNPAYDPDNPTNTDDLEDLGIDENKDSEE